ncbi:MAG: electron transfer flavoprotein subunit alpha/FixB family protein [Paludibacteraceae bacterium]|nr:electron transfer flavoprotein subunit alpha/FixB family protein [Paludibacteraceae bacterium]
MEKQEYQNVYIFAEQREGVIQNVAYELLGKANDLAKELGQHVVALLLGDGIADKAQDLIEMGADEVIVIDRPELRDYLTEQYTQAMYQVIMERKPRIVLYGATTIGRDLAPRLSCKLKSGLVADCTKLTIEPDKDGNLDFFSTRPAFGGNLMATIVCPTSRPQMSTVRPGVMQKMQRVPGKQGVITRFEPHFDASKFHVRLVETKKNQEKVADISNAKILISGGRGVHDAEGFKKLQGLADVMGGMVSSSRAMVDAGVMDHAYQVGQTGKTVRPNLYMACGISGAIQHLAGMEESGYIVAINKDKFAPIFSVADLGIVGDLHKIVPMLTERIKKELEK